VNDFYLIILAIFYFFRSFKDSIMKISRRYFLHRTGLSSLAAFSFGTTSVYSRTSQNLHKPPRLKPGDTVGVVSPASITYEQVRLEIMEETLAALNLKMKIGSHATDRWGYFAGSDQNRANSINELFADSDVNAIFALQGGWGCARLLPLLDYDLIRQHPKIFMGFSDITALLIALYVRCGLITFHGPTGNSTWNKFSTDYLRRILFDAKSVLMENPKEIGDNLTQIEDRIRTINPGIYRGRLVGGNLTVLSSIIGSKYLPDWRGHILFLEDIGEAIYRIDRMLTQLKLAGVLDQISGFVFGKCTDCKPDSGYSSFTFEEVLNDHIKSLGIPAWHGSMIGHIKNKFTIPLGVEVEIDATKGTIKMLEPAVI